MMMGTNFGKKVHTEWDCSQRMFYRLCRKLLGCGRTEWRGVPCEESSAMFLKIGDVLALFYLTSDPVWVDTSIKYS